MVKKKTVKKIKEKEPTKEEWEIKVLKQKIEMHQNGFDRYVDVLTRSAFIETCNGGAYFNKLYHGLLNKGVEALEFETPDISKEDKEELRNEWLFGRNMFLGDKKPTHKLSEQEKEKLILEKNLKYWKCLEEWAKNKLSDLNDELKKKIVIDSIKQQHLWMTQYSRNFKLHKQIEEIKSKKTKTKKK